ncbi:hypothetical protein [Halpernia sp. GG3]
MGSLNGAVSSGVEAIFNGENFFKGLYSGAIMGGAMAGIGWGISSVITMLTTPHYSYLNTSVEDLENSDFSGNSSPLDPSASTMRETMKKKGWDKLNTGVKQFYADHPTKRFITSGEWYYDTVEKEQVAGFTRFNNWNHTTSINLSKGAFASNSRLQFVMMHELAHSTILMNPALASAMLYKIEIDGKESYKSEMLSPMYLPNGTYAPTISIEHGAIWGIERDFINKNGSSGLSGVLHNSWGAYWDTYFSPGKAYNYVYEAIKNLAK